MNLLETAKQGLEALDWCIAEINRDSPASLNARIVIEPLRKAIEQAEKQKPVAWDGECVLGHCGSPSGCDDSGCCRAAHPQTGTWAVYIQDDFVWFEIADSISAQHFRIDHRPLTEDDFVITGSLEWMKRQLESALRKLTAPPQREWQGLTDEEIRRIACGDVECWSLSEAALFKSIARAIEAKLKEKNK